MSAYLAAVAREIELAEVREKLAAAETDLSALEADRQATHER